MQKTIKPWAESGTKVAMSDAEVALGWEANDQPAAENWNSIQNDRDNQQVSDAEARAVRLFGLHPSNLRGNDDSGIPIFRPNAFSEDENIWDSGAPINRYDGLQVQSASLGWDPANNMPVLVTLDSGSIISPGSSAQLRFFRAWNFDSAELTPEVRTIYFGFVTDSDESNMPIYVSDGSLYVSVAANATGYRYLLRYDLTTWTGFQNGIILQAARPVDVTEIAEIKGGYLGMFEQFTTNVSSDIGYIRFNRISKDMLSQAQVTAVTGCDILSKTCRTDGSWAYSYGRDASDYPVVIAQELDSFASSPEIYAPGSSKGDEFVSDIMPMQSGSAHPTGDKSAVCLIRKSTAPYGPLLRMTGAAGTFNWSEVFNFSVADSGFYFTTTTPAAFCCFGASTFVVLNRTVYNEGGGSDPYLELVKIERSQLLRVDNYPYVSSNSPEGILVGDALESYEQENTLHTRAFHDGRSVWVLDCYGGKIYRVVAPEIRCGK